MTRSKVAFSHFLLSLTIFSIVIFVLLFFWYPAPYFTASGGWQGLKIVASVDLVLGPLLTLIIFDINKTRAKLIGDLIVIALLQFSALAWGVTTIYNQRPVAVVYWENSFITVPAAAFNIQNIDLKTLAQFSADYPAFIYAEKPQTVEQLEALSNRIVNESLPPHHMLELYRPLSAYYSTIQSMQVDIDEIITANSDMKARLMTILQKSKTVITDYDYYPLRSKYHTIILMFSHEGELTNYIVVSSHK